MDNPVGQRFCGSCGSPLTAAPAAALPEERKVVTALFCDLVGFTAMSESADPEDIDRMLSAYFAQARAQIETHGGVVEKFIGDAVVGVFGVPAAHEDDPERAVRAALRICEDADRLQTHDGAPLRLRVGINTGEALVRLNVSPGSGERFLAGDAINTASRIQSVAPEMGVAVGLATHEATKATFDYIELEPATLKGKAEPVRVFHAIAPRARLGVDLTRIHDAPFVGREIDLALLTGLFDKTVAATSVQLVTVVGEPGIGKSRIVAELLGHAQAKAPSLTWRQGRCLPYGDGVTFWALGEIVKGQAGILESDDPDTASAKIDAAVAAAPDRDWLRQRLLPLVGVDVGSTAEREELFAAWRTFLETLADQNPTVLVFEDIHWADDAMLAFLEHLADRAEGVPLLILATARPELFERHPTFGAGLQNVNRINLGRLTDAETGRLVAGLLRGVVPDELRAPILERAEGNPLYAEELVRLLRDHDLLDETDGSVALKPGVGVPVPESIGALIAARLDTLSSERKSMLADAAVVGKVFWAGAVAAMGGRDPGDVVAVMRELARKELIRPARHSSMAGEVEYAFWHALVRDVAYAQLPRTSRATRHIAAAEWLEARAGDRAEDIAEVLAHHYVTALELARASGEMTEAERLEGPTLRFLSLSGDRALGLDAAVAISSFERALALTPSGHPGRPETLTRFGKAAVQRGRFAEAIEALEEAVEAFKARGDPASAAGGLEELVLAFSRLGDSRQWTLPFEALAILEPLGRSPELVRVLTEVAANQSILGRFVEAIASADRALGLAKEMGLPMPGRALGFRGSSRANLGDAGGLLDMREAIEVVSAAGEGREVVVLDNNLAVALWAFEGPTANLDALRDGIRHADARGLTDMSLSLRCGLLDVQVDLGELDRVLEEVIDLSPGLEASGARFNLVTVRTAQARVAVIRGCDAASTPWLPWFEATAREIGAADVTPALGAAAGIYLWLGRPDHAVTLLDEVVRSPEARSSFNYSAYLPMMVRTAIGIGDIERAEGLAAGQQPHYPLAEHAIVTAQAAIREARGDLEAAADGYADAADRWRRFGVVPERAFALLGEGRCLLAIGRRTEAAIVLRETREIFARLKAAPSLKETEVLIEQSPAGASTTL